MKNRNLNHQDHWATPKEWYDNLDAEFHFDFDPCPLHHDITLWDGLKVHWGRRNFVNPPYSRKLKEAFILKAIEEQRKGNLSVLLLPVSTSTKIFHHHLLPAIKNRWTDLRFVEGRIPFQGINKKGQRVNFLDKTDDSFVIQYEGEMIPLYIKNSGQHDSMIVVLWP